MFDTHLHYLLIVISNVRGDVRFRNNQIKYIKTTLAKTVNAVNQPALHVGRNL